MGLLPLEFTDCLQDSPYFRDSLHSHEKELERTSQAIKELIKEVKTLLQAAKTLSQAQRRLSQRLIDFKFECIGNRQTDDEIIIASSLKEFGKLIAAIEDEKDRMLERAYEQFIEPLEEFRRKQIGAVKEGKKKFEKQTAKFCSSQEKYLGLSTKKQDTLLQEADATLEMEQRDFIRAGLEYVYLIQEVQERKKFEFVETLLAFMYGWLTFYHQGHEVAKDFNPHMQELQSRIQKTRENFNASRADIQALMRKMLEVRNAKPIDPGTLNKLYTRTGYLFLMEKKALGTTWNKYYCHYQREGRLFCMIPYNQTTPKILSNETFRLKHCIKRISESIDKRFCFDIIPEDKPGITHTFQALSQEDLELWLDAMDGKEAMYVMPPKPSDASETYLDEAGFNFVQRCFQVLESRGLEEQGLYRVVGVSSKVTKLLTMGLDRRKAEKLNLEDGLEWESKTITSAVKTYYRNLPEPIMTFKFHTEFIAAAKLETYQERVAEVQRLMTQIPEPNKHMLELLLRHLEKVAGNSDRNMMTVSNLGVCFGPTLLRSEEETVAAIMDIKFGNVVVEILVENWRQILGDPGSQQQQQPPLLRRPVGRTSTPPTKPPSSSTRLSLQQNTPRGVNVATPLSRVVSPPHRPPPPYQNPPPAPGGLHGGGGSVAALAQAVIDNNGPKQALLPLKKPTGPPPAGPPINPPSSSANSPPTTTTASPYATWERPLRQTVPPPLTSAPSVGGGDEGGGRQPGWTPGYRGAVHRQLSSGSQQGMGSFEDSSYSDYPPLAPRPQISPRPHVPIRTSADGGGGGKTSLGKMPSAGGESSSGGKTGILHPENSSSSSIESLTSGSSSRGNMSGSLHQEQLQSSDNNWTQPVISSGSRQMSASLHQDDTWQPAGGGHGGGQMSASLHHESAESWNHPPVAPARASLIGSNSAPMSSPFFSNQTSSQDTSPGQQGQHNEEGEGDSSPSGEGGRTVRTLYACVAEHETELSFEPNQIITKVRPSLEPGWLEGCLDGRFGLVPENYIEYIT